MVTNRSVYRYAYRHVRIHTYISLLCRVCGQSQGEMTTAITSKSSPQLLVPNTVLLRREPALLGEVAHSSTGAGNAQDGHLVVRGSKEALRQISKAHSTLLAAWGRRQRAQKPAGRTSNGENWDNLTTEKANKYRGEETKLPCRRIPNNLCRYQNLEEEERNSPLLSDSWIRGYFPGGQCGSGEGSRGNFTEGHPTNTTSSRGSRSALVVTNGSGGIDPWDGRDKNSL